MKPAIKVTIKDDAFKGAKFYNGQIVTQEANKESGEPLTGVSGKTKRFSMSNGGCVFLTEDQYTVNS